MMRSILWISSRAPSSPFSIGCVALPQPRSRMALAAAIRAGGGALVLRMTPTRTFSAVLVWLRAIDRISVMLLGIVWLCLRHFRPSSFARRRVEVIHDQIVGSRQGAESDVANAIMPAVANEVNDLCVQDNPSHSVRARSPTNAMAIK